MKRGRDQSGKTEDDGGGVVKEEKAAERSKLAGPPKDRTAKVAAVPRKGRASKVAEESSKTFTMDDQAISTVRFSRCSRPLRVFVFLLKVADDFSCWGGVVWFISFKGRWGIHKLSTSVKMRKMFVFSQFISSFCYCIYECRFILCMLVHIMRVRV